MERTVKCTFCKKEFKAKRPHAIFCSPKCRIDYHFKKKDDIIKAEIATLNERIKELEEENAKLKNNKRRIK
jgi:hypothetical protein